MKTMILSLIAGMIVLNSSLSMASTLSRAEKKAVLKVVRSDVMLRDALAEAKKIGKCTGEVVEASNNGASGTEFEVQFRCETPADDLFGGGVFLMIDVKGRIFGNSLENSVITVQKAG